MLLATCLSIHAILLILLTLEIDLFIYWKQVKHVLNFNFEIICSLEFLAIPRTLDGQII